jgi:hypothetical protein
MNAPRNPLNQLPTSAEWIAKGDAAAAHVAAAMGCPAVVVVLQEGGKMGVFTDGVPDTGPIAEAMRDMPRFFHTLSLILSVNDAIEDSLPKS